MSMFTEGIFLLNFHRRPTYITYGFLAACNTELAIIEGRVDINIKINGLK